MVAMFRCVYAEEAGKLGSWGKHGGAGDRRATLAGFPLASILSDLLSDKEFRAIFFENSW